MTSKATARDVREVLRGFDANGAPPLDDLLEVVCGVLGLSHGVTYRALPDAEGATTEFFAARGFERKYPDRWHTALRAGAPILNYDPIKPQASQRNRVLDVNKVFPGAPGTEAIRRCGFVGYEQIRVLLCDGDVMLGWIGGFRLAPFTRHESRVFERLVEPLQRAYALDRRLRDGSVATAGLVAALERIGTPAFVATRSGCIQYANASGRALLDRSPRSARSAVAGAIEHFERGRPTRAEVTRLAVGAYWLVILSDPDGTAPARIGTSASEWRLTPRQTDVLRAIARGDSNKMIAHRLGCTEATVEAHATAVFRKAGVDGRTALIAKLLGTR